MDRIDIHIEVPAIKFNEISSDRPAEPSSAIRERVTGARAIQYARFLHDGIYANAHMKPRHIRKYCRIDEDSLRLMETAMNRLGLSARAYNRILKVARPSPTSTEARRSQQSIYPRRYNTGAWTGG